MHLQGNKTYEVILSLMVGFISTCTCSCYIGAMLLAYTCMPLADPGLGRCDMGKVSLLVAVTGVWGSTVRRNSMGGLGQSPSGFVCCDM